MEPEWGRRNLGSASLNQARMPLCDRALQKSGRFDSAIFYLNAKAAAAKDAPLAIVSYHGGLGMIHCSGLRDRRHTIDGPA
jgi:hypothetical protein